MKKKEFKEKIENGIDKNKNIKHADKKWVLKITILAFAIAFLMSLLSEIVIPNVWIILSVFLILVFVVIGIIFDIIGIAVTTAEEKIFHSMATKQVKGAKIAIKFITNKDKVSSFCNDVIGDICGVISGSCGLTIALKLGEITKFNQLIITVIITSIISAITIGGKAIGKSIAVNNSNTILLKFSRFVNIFYKKEKIK